MMQPTTTGPPGGREVRCGGREGPRAAVAPRGMAA